MGIANDTVLNTCRGVNSCMPCDVSEAVGLVSVGLLVSYWVSELLGFWSGFIPQRWFAPFAALRQSRAQMVLRKGSPVTAILELQV